MSKPILCLDFDGVIHSYKSGWVEADFIPDPPVPGAFAFIAEAIKQFEVQIYSSRSHQEGGIRAMALWMRYWAPRELTNADPDYKANGLINALGLLGGSTAFPKQKPAAMITIDDRALTFDGTWPAIDTLKAFTPWNKRAAAGSH